MFQDVYLFDDTIRNNIKFGNPDADDAEMIEVAKKARCHDFIMELPNGYDTVLQEGGSNLSGGERQRISIERSMLKPSKIVILDEATSSIDPENEQQLLIALDNLLKDKTTIVIAHKLNTIKNAEQIVVLEKGMFNFCSRNSACLVKRRVCHAANVAGLSAVSQLRLQNGSQFGNPRKLRFSPVAEFLGKIESVGTHDQLMQNSPIYRKFISYREETKGWQVEV